MAESGITQYTITLSQQEVDKLRRWGEWAKEQGILEDYLVALKTIDYRLSFEPAEWGESRYPLQELGLEVRFGICKMLQVWYGVNYHHSVVYVKVFQFRKDDPHGGPPES